MSEEKERIKEIIIIRTDIMTCPNWRVSLLLKLIIVAKMEFSVYVISKFLIKTSFVWKDTDK